MARQTGTTTKQMQDAPKKAIYVWCNSHLDYPVHLSHSLGRNDLKIVRPEWLDWNAWRGVEPTQIVIDHALRPTERQYCAIDAIKTKLRILNTPSAV